MGRVWPEGQNQPVNHVNPASEKKKKTVLMNLKVTNLNECLIPTEGAPLMIATLNDSLFK